MTRLEGLTNYSENAEKLQHFNDNCVLANSKVEGEVVGEGGGASKTHFAHRSK